MPSGRDTSKQKKVDRAPGPGGVRARRPPSPGGMALEPQVTEGAVLGQRGVTSSSS